MNAVEPPRRWCASFQVPPSHPALPGHFPGQPLVPGVWLLDRVVAALEQALGPCRLAGLPQVKFLRPLLPGQDAGITLEGLGAQRVRFRVTRDDELLASGELELAP